LTKGEAYCFQWVIMLPLVDIILHVMPTLFFAENNTITGSIGVLEYYPTLVN
jgi:hypothetical protein